MIGGTVGSVAHHLLPHITAHPGAYAVMGMGTAFAGIVRTPLTSLIMLFEMTRDYSAIVPLMISNLISFFISQQLRREPIYEARVSPDRRITRGAYRDSCNRADASRHCAAAGGCGHDERQTATGTGEV
jgi:H+/Cl- antiporter ClcA